VTGQTILDDGSVYWRGLPQGYPLLNPWPDPDFVPAGWKQQTDFYKAAVKPYCMMCHLATPSNLDFSTYRNFAQNKDLIKAEVCSGHTCLMRSTHSNNCGRKIPGMCSCRDTSSVSWALRAVNSFHVIWQNACSVSSRDLESYPATSPRLARALHVARFLAGHSLVRPRRSASLRFKRQITFTRKFRLGL